jgi:2-iminobutanoate/2-iminopropanoate deaminase
MARQILTTEAAPSSPLFSQGIRAGSTVHVSGMVGMDVGTGELPESIHDQTRQAIRNCALVLEAGGASLSDVTMVTVLLANPPDFAGMNEAYAEMFGDDPPARAVARLGPELPGIRVSIFMTAHIED